MRKSSILATALVAALSALAAACAAPPSSTAEHAAATDHAMAMTADAQALGPAVNTQLAALRRETAPFHNIEKAKAAKWDTAITPCWYHGTQGAMGYHYAEPARIDGTVDSLRPEALIYEPQQGGAMSLVGVEYIVKISDWTAPARPRLYDREFDRNDQLGLYVLHVWAWRENPAGMFAAWNPKVSCQYAAQSEDRG